MDVAPVSFYHELSLSVKLYRVTRRFKAETACVLILDVSAEVARALEVAPEMHREKVSHLDLVGEQRGASTEIRALTLVDREHCHIKFTLLLSYTVKDSGEVSFSLVNLSLCGLILPMPVIEIARMENSLAIGKRHSEAYTGIGRAKSLDPYIARKIIYDITHAHVGYLHLVLRRNAVAVNIVGQHINSLMILGEVIYLWRVVVGMMMTYEKQHRKLPVAVENFVQRMSRILIIIKDKDSLISGYCKSAMV